VNYRRYIIIIEIIGSGEDIFAHPDLKAGEGHDKTKNDD